MKPFIRKRALPRPVVLLHSTLTMDNTSTAVDYTPAAMFDAIPSKLQLPIVVVVSNNYDMIEFQLILSEKVSPCDNVIILRLLSSSSFSLSTLFIDCVTRIPPCIGIIQDDNCTASRGQEIQGRSSEPQNASSEGQERD